MSGRIGRANHASGPYRLSSRSPIWRNAPSSAGEQGQMSTFNPDFSYIKAFADGTGLTTARAAGTVGDILIGTESAYFHMVDTNNGDAELIKSSGGRLLMATNTDILDLCTLGFWGHLAGGVPPLPFLPVASSVIRFGIKAKVDDADDLDFLIGLGVVDTTPIAAITDGIFFRKLGTDTQPDLVLDQNSTETVLALTDDAGSAIAVADDTYFEAGFVIHGVSQVNAYWNGHGKNNIQTTVTYLDDDEPLCPIIAIGNETDAVSTITVERLVCTQTVV